MHAIRIRGTRKLRRRIQVSGAKNAALQLTQVGADIECIHLADQD